MDTTQPFLTIRQRQTFVAVLALAEIVLLTIGALSHGAQTVAGLFYMISGTVFLIASLYTLAALEVSRHNQ